MTHRMPPTTLDTYELAREADRQREERLAAALQQRIKELEAALSETIWQINYIAGHGYDGYVGNMKRDHAEAIALEAAKTAAALLKGAKPK